MSDIILDNSFQSHMGTRDFGRVDAGYGNLLRPEIVKCSLMKMLGADGKWNGRLGVAKEGGRYVVPLPKGYDWNVGILPQDGRLLITRPGMATLIANCEDGTCRRA